MIVKFFVYKGHVVYISMANKSPLQRYVKIEFHSVCGVV